MEEAGNLLERARTARANNRNEEAIRLALKAVEEITLLSEGYLLLSDLYYEAGRLEEALGMARKFAYLEPERPEGQYQLALVQKALGKKQRAAHSYRRLLNLLEQYQPEVTFEFLPGLSCESLKIVASRNLENLE